MKVSKKFMSLILLAAFIFSAANLFAQEGNSKKALGFEDYARWRSITSTSISDDGNWITFGYSKRDADDTLYVKNITTDKEFVIPNSSRPRFSDDEKWIAYTLSLPQKEAEKLRKANKPVPNKAQLMNLVTGEKTTTWDNVASFNFSKGSKFLAVKKTKSDPDAKHKGTDLILRNLEKGFDDHIGSVASFSFNKPGSLLAYIVDAADTTGNGLILIELDSGSRNVLDTDRAIYERMTWEEEGTALAVLKGTKKKGFIQIDNTLLAFTGLDSDEPVRFEYNPAEAYDFPSEMVISEKTGLSWSEDLTKVFFGITEQEKEPEKKKDAEPVADVDIFHWKDDRIQSVQRAQAERDRNFAYRAVFKLSDKRFVQLTDKSMRTISITRDGKWGIGQDNRAYISDWKESAADYYRVNTATGEKTLIFKAHGRTMGLSPDSKHYLYWKDGHVWDYKIESGEKLNLTRNAPVSFVNTEYDHPGTVPPYGVTGWTKDGKSVILTHRYDLWLQPLDGSTASNLTGGMGDRDEIRFRYVRTDPEERFIDLSKPVLLSAYGEWTKKAGYYELNDGRLEKLIYDDKSFGRVTKAKNADKFMYTIQTFRDYPDYYVSDTKFSYPKRITDANPFQSEYKWGYRILFDFENSQGVRLQGTLAIPDDYEDGQRFPMLVNFYEKNSQNLHRYTAPRYASSPQFARFISNGYLVMQPDVHFNTRTSHSDMLECVEAAVKKVIEMGYADPEHIGLHGHSYSGGGACFISTRSKMFAAIAAGAAPINLAGEFNILFKGSGQNNHSYDIYGQGRYGTNPYDDFELYWDQSPISGVTTMDTPLLYLHGVDDPTVEYNQGMEFYNALRFNGKPVIFLSYPGEGHSLRKLENQKDYTRRVHQFFDHYLKGEPAPDWIVKGVPYLKKEK